MCERVGRWGGKEKGGRKGGQEGREGGRVGREGGNGDDSEAERKGGRREQGR